MMNTSRKWIAFPLLIAALVLLNIIAANIPGQLDLTRDSLYTLSPGSRELLSTIEEPVSLEFYFSRTAEGIPILFKNYATRVEDLLRQYAKAARGGIRLSIIEPEPDTDEEQQAIRAGLRPVPLPNGDQLFFGLRAIQADQEETIPFFTNDRESFLEYDISQIIYQVQQVERPVIGVLTGLPMFGAPVMPGQPPSAASQEWTVIRELRKTWEVRQLNGEIETDNLDVLAVIHPSDVTPRQQFAIDQAVLAGTPLFLALDPSSYIQRSQQQNQQMMMMQGPQSASSDLPELLAAWGIEYAPDNVIGDFRYGRVVGASPGSPPVQYPPLIDFRDFSRDLPPTSALQELTVAEPGAFEIGEDSALELQPLLVTSRESGTIPAQVLNFTQIPSVRNQVDIDDETYTVAGLLRGNLKTAFPDGLPKNDESESEAAGEDTAAKNPVAGGDLLRESVEPATILFLADSDLLSDPFSVQVINFLGTQAVQPLNDNLDFSLNLFDYIGGSEDLLALRGKGRTTRPFTRIEKMELTAQEEYQRELNALDDRLSEVQTELRNLRQAQGDNGNMLVASPEVLRAIEKYQLQEAELRADRREIRKKLREDIEATEMQLALFNLLTMPILIAVFGIQFFIRRANRHKQEDTL